MGLIDVFRRRKTESNGSPFAAYLSTLVGGRRENLSNATFWSCVIQLAQMYGSMPFHAYEKTADGLRKKLGDDALLTRLLEEPNPYMDAYVFKFIMGFNFELHGEAIATIERSRNGLPIAIYPVSPNQIIKYTKNGELFYKHAEIDKVYTVNDVLDIQQTPSGYTTVLSPSQYASDDIDLENKCRQLQKEYYNGGSVVGNLISTPSGFNSEDKAKIKSAFDSARGFRNFVMDERIKITPIQIPSNDVSRLIEAQKWTAKEVARRFRVPSFFVGDTENVFSSAEQQDIHFVKYCFRPRIIAWEMAFNKSICKPNQYVKFNLDGLMRGDSATQASYLSTMVNNGIMTRNEARSLLDLEPVGEEGDVLIMQMNQGTLKDIVDGKFANGSSASIWNVGIPDEEDESVKGDVIKEKAESLEEKKAREVALYEKASSPSKSARRTIEKTIRSNMRAAFDKVKELKSNYMNLDSILDVVSDYLNEISEDYIKKYESIYKAVIKAMIPEVARQCNSSNEVDEDRIKNFAEAYATSLSGRISGKTYKFISSRIYSDTFDEDYEEFLSEAPTIESDNEVNRSANAFSIFLYQQFNVTKYHVVASVDSCAFCQTLDGKTVSIDGYVLRKGDKADDGDGGVRYITKNFRHPPFHEHCSCGVLPN